MDNDSKIKDKAQKVKNAKVKDGKSMFVSSF